MAPGRVASPRWLRRQQPTYGARLDHTFLQSTRHRRAAHQGRQASDQLDTIVVQCMVQNEVRLQLHTLAYNLGVFLQGTDLPEQISDWSLTSLQTRLIKIGARVVRHARTITFQLAEIAVSGALFSRILTEIQRLRAPPVPE